jgi:fimbrial isopeptide formation D2 family protein
VTDAGTPTPLAESVYPEINLAHAPSNGGGGATPPVINGPVGNTNNNPSGGGGGGGGNSNSNLNNNGNENGNLPAGGNNPSGSPVEPGTTDATYHFTNPGNADSFNLYDAPPNSSMRPLAQNPDPTATTITETGLTPNTIYSNRVITAVANGSESAPSPAFPTFTTLLTNFDSVTASYDPIAKTVSLTATGTLPNLTVGQSGVDFVIKDASGTVLFDSGFVQTPSPGSLASANLEPGETYTVTVTPRNQDGVLSPPEDFPITIPAGTEIKAKITLTKSAEKTDFPSSVNALTRETTQNTKEIKYTITAANTGNGIAKTFVMTDPLPEGIDLKSGSISVVKNLNDADDVVNTSYDAATRTVTATLDELEPGESFTVTFVATPTPGTASSTVRNKASASWEE